MPLIPANLLFNPLYSAANTSQDAASFSASIAAGLSNHMTAGTFPGYADGTYQYVLTAPLLCPPPVAPLLDLYTGSGKETDVSLWGLELGTAIADFWGTCTFVGTKTQLSYPFSVIAWAGAASSSLAKAGLIAALTTLYNSGNPDVDSFRTALETAINTWAGKVYLENPLFFIV
jgi:hypothetical protein